MKTLEKLPHMAVKLTIAGQEVHFCRCPYCHETFQKAPEYYTNRLEGAEQEAGYREPVREASDRGAVTAISRGDGDFDLVIVGGGSAGFAAAIKGAELGARVAMAEASTLGGTCVNVGCVPSKTLIRAAEANHRRAHHGFKGIAARDGRTDGVGSRTGGEGRLGHRHARIQVQGRAALVRRGDPLRTTGDGDIWQFPDPG